MFIICSNTMGWYALEEIFQNVLIPWVGTHLNVPKCSKMYSYFIKIGTFSNMLQKYNLFN